MSTTLNANGFDTGSNYNFGDKLMRPQFPRSVFDLSHLVNTTIDNAGLVFPITCFRTVPSDEFDISVRSLLRVLPQVVPLYSRQRLYIYGFYSRNGDLWENWNVFMSKGRTGNVVKHIPTLNVNNVSSSTDSVVSGSVAERLGIPAGTSFNTLRSGKFSALPFMMYARIWRDYFFNKNFALNNTVLFPYNDDRFRLNDDGVLLSALDDNFSFSFGSGLFRSALQTDRSGYLSYDSDSTFRFFNFFHNYPDDYFTSALPFQQRGTAPTLNLGAVSGLSLSSTSNLAAVPFVSQSDLDSNSGFSSFYGAVNGDDFGFYLLPFTSLSSYSGEVVGRNFNFAFNDWLNKASITGNISAGVTLNSIRELAISQLELERMARTDGSYAQFGETFFGVTPKNAIDYKPVYIGGTYTGINFTEVLQTSQTTDSSALGQYAGHGIAADNSGYLGHVYCDDYGLIMILGCIMPDVYYHQGISKMWTELSQSDMLLPDRAKLGMQPILNQEIFLQDYSVVDDDGNPVNENLWAYQDVFDDYRYMPNRVSGKIANKDALSFYPYTQSRTFDKLPNWSKEFVEARNVRKDFLAAPSEVAYTAQFSIDIRAVRPLPYQSVPAQVVN